MGEVDDELQGRRGTVMSEQALAAEGDASNKSQTPGEFAEKLKTDTEAAGGGVGGAIRAVVHHVDRELAGEYERREDPEATPSPQAGRDDQLPPGRTAENR